MASSQYFLLIEAKGVCISWEKILRGLCIASWLALYSVGFWDKADALIFLEQKCDEWGISLGVVAVMEVAGAEEIERASSIMSTNSKPTL